MSDTPSAPSAPGLGYPYLLTRTYLCGHPTEHIQVDVLRPPNQAPVILHTYVPEPKPTALRKPYKQTLERCAKCAEEHQAQKQRLNPRKPARSLAAHQGESQNSKARPKDGFLEVLARYKLQNPPRVPVKWKDEGAENSENNAMKEALVQAEEELRAMPHTAIPYRSRKDKHVAGPVQLPASYDGGSNQKSGYIIMVDVHDKLIEAEAPLPLPEPELQRHSDSVLIEENRLPWPQQGTKDQNQSNRRDSGITSLSLGDQPLNSTLLSRPSRTQSTRARGGPPLPVMRSRRDMLKENVTTPSGSTSPRTPRTPRLSDESWRYGGIWESDGGGVKEEQWSQLGSLPGSQRTSHEGVRRHATVIHRHIPHETATPNPYQYSPWGLTEPLGTGQVLRRANTTQPRGNLSRPAQPGIFAESHFTHSQT